MNKREREEQFMAATQAAEWLETMQSNGMPHEAEPEAKKTFLRWLLRSPEHVAETLAAQSTDIVLRQLLSKKKINVSQFGAAGAQVIGIAGHAAPPSHARNKRQLWIKMAGLSAGLAAGVALLVHHFASIKSESQPQFYATATGELQSVQLTDGSAIAINAQSKVRVAFSEQARDIYLTTGQAMFTVAKDPARPFRVHAGDAVVQAIGTKFDVRKRDGRIDVAVIEGRVQAGRVQIAAGQAARISNDGKAAAPTPVNVSDVSAWQQRRLVFSNNTLAEIAEEFSRFNRKPQLRIEGEALKARRLSGVFDADSPEALLIYLASDRRLTFERGEDEVVIKAD